MDSAVVDFTFLNVSLLLFMNCSLVPFFYFALIAKLTVHPLAVWCESNKQTLQLWLKCTCMLLLTSLFPPLLILILLLSALSLFSPQTWSIQRTTPDHNRPDQIRLSPDTDPTLSPSPPPALQAASTSNLRSSPLAVIYCADQTTSDHWDWTGDPEVPPRWSSKLCLAMPQVRGTTEGGVMYLTHR